MGHEVWCRGFGVRADGRGDETSLAWEVKSGMVGELCEHRG